MRFGFAVLVAASLCGRVAAAEPRDRLAVGKLEVLGEAGVPQERLDKLKTNLLGGFAAIGWTVISPEETRASLPDPALRSCQSDACFKAVGEATKAQWVIAGTISSSGSTTYSADLRLIDVTSGRAVATYSNSCGVCTTKEANDWLALVAADLKQQAMVWRGVPKAEGPAAAPAAAVAATPEGPTRTQLILRYGGIAAGVLGLAGVILGIVEAARDTDLCASVPDGATCVRHRDTTAGQGFGFGLGFPLLAAGVTMSVFGWRHPPARKLAIAPVASPTGAGVVAGWRF